MHTVAMRALALVVASMLAGAARAGEEEGLWESTKATIGAIADEPGWDIYLTGYAYHSRGTYSRDRLSRMNENAWGGGFGKTFRNSHGNDESMYAVGFRDSRYKPQWIAGYAYAWTYPVNASGIEVGAGITAAITRRSDWFGGTPIPVALPFASIGGQRGKLIAALVPRISTNKGKGNVILFMGRFNFG